MDMVSAVSIVLMSVALALLLIFRYQVIPSALSKVHIRRNPTSFCSSFRFVAAGLAPAEIHSVQNASFDRIEYEC